MQDLEQAIRERLSLVDFGRLPRRQCPRALVSCAARNFGLILGLVRDGLVNVSQAWEDCHQEAIQEACELHSGRLTLA
jgi:hypothetical protein